VRDRESGSVMVKILRCFCLVFLLASPSALKADAVTLPADLSQVAFVEVAKNIYVLHGLQQLPNQGNKGLISNTGIVVTDIGVVLVDSGGSYAVGRLIVDRVKKITSKPIVAVFNSHIHGDHWLGNAAIREAFPKAKIFAHKNAVKRLNAGAAENWQSIMRGMVGNKEKEPALVLPNVALDGSEAMTFGGVKIQSHHTGHAHTDGDIMIEVPDRRLLFTGDIVEYGRLVSSDVPQDFDAKGQIAAIKYILGLPVDIFVPGHGETGGKNIPAAALRFLEKLYASVKKYYGAGLKDYEMKDKVVGELSEFRDWYNFDQIGKMISFVYQQVEFDDFK
jgi:glyoxylase-like metal-dependent hydrolase (beta-lactamase superfamily II)